MRYALSFPVRYLLISLCLLAAFYSFLLARAQWLFEQDTATSIPKAVQLVPYNSAYLSRLAAWRSDEKISLLQRAVHLDPFDYESLIQLGFHSEFQLRNQPAAEHYYLRAAEVNKVFLPKWTLTNYYFRHGRAAEFFHWATQTLAITPYSAEPIFLQMWLISQDAKRISRSIPDRPRILLPYAWFLSNSLQNSAIAPVVRRLIEAVGKRNPQAWGRDDLLATIEDRLVADGDRASALDIWTSMVKAGWIRKSSPTITEPITNGSFQTPSYQHGFDWMPLRVPGIRIDQRPSESLLRLEFSGNQPETCALLKQYLPLEPGRSYLLQSALQSSLPGGPTGLRWHLQPVGRSHAVELLSNDLKPDEPQIWNFRAPYGSELSILTLEYARPLGSLRARGTVFLRNVSARAD